MDTLHWKRLELPPPDEAEILRYAGVRTPDDAVTALLRRCLAEIGDQLTGQVCWRRFPLTVDGEECDLSFARWRSRDLARCLEGCDEAVIFAATVGMSIDRLIARRQITSPAGAVMLQAIGTERIEAACDLFNRQIKAETIDRGRYCRPRFSPGYGDLPLAAQRDLFRALDCERRLGMTLNDSLLISPSKSVTAVIGVGPRPCADAHIGCAVCDQADCAFRKK